MGFISKLFGGIFALLGGIFGGVFKLFGLGKKSEYFLEADAATSAPAPAKAPVPAKMTKAETKTETPAPKPEAPAAASTNGKVEKPAPTVAAATPVAAAEPQIKNFATNYSTNGTSSRRRPGPSLNPFLDMAKQMKTPG